MKVRTAPRAVLGRVGARVRTEILAEAGALVADGVEFDLAETGGGESGGKLGLKFGIF